MSLTKFRNTFWRAVPNSLMVVGLGLAAVSLVPYLRDEVWYFLKQHKGQQFILADRTGQKDSVFARYLSAKPITLQPASTDFGLVIEKIGVNAPIVADVTVADESAYHEALKSGVAHAASSAYPSREPGNVYLFAHSSLAFWQAGKYAQVFNLVRKLEVGDAIHVFYRGDDYVYRAVSKSTYKGFNTYALTRPVIEPLLTLQTCDPPGTALNRLVVTAKLIAVQ
ncbi:MAG: sortase [bacterium]